MYLKGLFLAGGELRVGRRDGVPVLAAVRRAHLRHLAAHGVRRNHGLDLIGGKTVRKMF